MPFSCHLAGSLPLRSDDKSVAEKQINRIFIDDLRSGFRVTTVAARLGVGLALGMSMPLAQDELANCPAWPTGAARAWTDACPRRSRLERVCGIAQGLDLTHEKDEFWS